MRSKPPLPPPTSMPWDELPLDILAHVFSFLPPTSTARAMLACKHWLASARSRATPTSGHGAPWLAAMPYRSQGGPRCSCYAYDPEFDRWHVLPLDSPTGHLRLVASVGSLLLCKLSSSTLRLGLLNPFARHFERLPSLITPRSNPAIGVVVRGSDDLEAGCFCVIVAGGASGACYEPTVEMYDSRTGSWCQMGSMPMEFAVRLTVWTPNESVHAGDGVVYWMTSARAYSVVGFDVGRRAWREVKVPMADRLEWAALVRRPRGGRLGLVGGSCDCQGSTWELRDGDEWALVGAVPLELGMRFRGRGESASATRCVGGEEAVYLFRELGSDMLVWKPACTGAAPPETSWEWSLLGGRFATCLPNVPIRATLLHPTL